MSDVSNKTDLSLGSSTTENASSNAKAVGKALRDLDALGDWIDNELHYSQSNSFVPEAIGVNNTSVMHDYENASPTPEPATDIMNHKPTSQNTIFDDVAPPLPEKMRVIRRGKRRFIGK